MARRRERFNPRGTIGCEGVGVGSFGVKGAERATGVVENGMCGCHLVLKCEKVGSKWLFRTLKRRKCERGGPKWPFRDCISSNVREGWLQHGLVGTCVSERLSFCVALPTRMWGITFVKSQYLVWIPPRVPCEVCMSAKNGRYVWPCPHTRGVAQLSISQFGVGPL